METDAPETVPADGSKATFLTSVKRRLHLGIKEIRDRKVYLAQQAERREHFEEATAGMSARAKAMVHEDIERPFASRACVLEVLELLRLMCEGHHVEMQEYIRTQPHQVTSHDLVTEVYLFLLALEPELDGTNVDQALKALETLTELVQGNTTYANTQLLLQTKLVSILERLIEKKALEGGKEVALAEVRGAIESGPG